MISQFFIEPKKIEQTATFILVESRVTLNQTAAFSYALCTENGTPLKHDELILTEEQYANWGTDDSYVLNLICEKEGLTLA